MDTTLIVLYFVMSPDPVCLFRVQLTFWVEFKARKRSFSSQIQSASLH
jgi:hypothetical protein